ncbi:MAG: hypothetical protein A3F13_02800 [Gammaproteobacteria bacterium RIFCSPHIGHO2_12_FULL_40_19]|nr:MAG: hypothetical protein A3F13_02800 [Gammaproteobacteria bacterium RIFCSPHIGHO2_12_FULL_40_19]
MKHVLTIPMRLMSEANTHQHWRKKYERNKRQTNGVRLVWSSQCPSVAIPCRVCLVRTGPRKLDSDNLVYAFKAIRDEVGALIRPGLVAGQADADGQGIEWSYGQEIGLYGIRIEIEHDQPLYRDGKALC